ncbi:MAG: PepSY-associated TM helix domain-containing protein [Sporomusaceae bacterium]|nr:PepSY-associated TM helix domain-containing protein [Sporomusaceae bacterium]
MRFLYQLHRWVSVVCTIFFLLLCITGIPLIFKDEVQQWNRLEQRDVPTPLTYDQIWDGMPVGQDKLKKIYPQKVIKSITAQPEKGRLLFRVQDQADHRQIAARMSMGGEQLAYESAADQLYRANGGNEKYPAIKNFMHWMHILHLRLALGSGGMLLLGIICALSLAAILSGMWLYGPFSRNTLFGMCRREPKRRFYLDWHRYTGVLTFMWASVMCISGIAIVWFSFAYNSYIATVTSEAAQKISIKTELSQPRSLRDAMLYMEQTFPNDYILSVDLPQEHSKVAAYTFYITEKQEHPAEHMGQLVFLSAFTATSSESYTKPLPGYFSVFPFLMDLHLHNHESLLLKCLWELFSILTIMMTLTGIYGWLLRFGNKQYKHSVTTSDSISYGKKSSVWIMPAWIAVLSLIGLVAPLYGIFGQIIGSVALIIPVGMFVYFRYRRS